MTSRNQRGANSQDFQLMFLQDVNAVSTIQDGDLLRFDEASETFMPVSTDYGSMYANDITQVVTISQANTFFHVPGGLTGGTCFGFVFQNSKELRCTRAGTYEVVWSMSVITSTGANQHLEGCVMINTTAQVNTMNATHVQTSSDEQSVAGAGIVTLVAGDLIRLAVDNEGSAANVTVTHANLVVRRIG